LEYLFAPDTFFPGSSLFPHAEQDKLSNLPSTNL
jgi:hypothetical protein